MGDDADSIQARPGAASQADAPLPDTPLPNAPLADGSYDVFVIDAHQDEADASRVVIEVTLIDGEHKGEVLSLGSPSDELLSGGGDPIELLGETGMLTVTGGSPRFQLDR